MRFLPNQRNSQSEREIYIGLVAPLGTNLDQLVNCLERELANHRYSPELIRLSTLLAAGNPAQRAYKNNPKKSQSELLMDAGDGLRSHYNDGAALAVLGMAKIRDTRRERGLNNSQNNRIAWILRTVKHPREVEALRYTYGSRFILIGVNEAKPSRTSNAEEIIAKYDPTLSDRTLHATKLIERDETDSVNDLGQHVLDANAMSDFFVEIGSELIHDVKRIVSLLFGQPFVTPTRDEVAMFQAFGASLRSADAGRQVGAVVTTSDGDLIATGTNEVPKPGGGQYWDGDEGDYRDFQVGRDYNKHQSRQVVSEVLAILEGQNLLHPSLGRLRSEDRLEKLLDSAPNLMKSSRALSLVEFGRITHAEMSALMECARHGRSTQSATIYVTAFPCHMCMRLIIASGIQRVVFVDPYPKSLSLEMYGRILNTTGWRSSQSVRVEPYRGASWRMYPQVFTMINRDRNADGLFKSYSPSDRTFRIGQDDDLASSSTREARAVALLFEDGMEKGHNSRNAGAWRNTSEKWSVVHDLKALKWLVPIVLSARTEVADHPE